MLKFVVFLLVLGSIALLSQVFISLFLKRYQKIQEEKTREASRALEDMFVWVEQKRLLFVLGLAPFIGGIVLSILFKKITMFGFGLVLGFVLPSLAIKRMEQLRRRKFEIQLIDALVGVSFSLKAGLSFLQAMEVLVEEMQPPISQEFGLILKENKMGKSLEDSFEQLNKRMKLEDLNLMTTAILVARETGGNLTTVFSHLADAIRQKRRISEQVKTLTTQARWQGIIMTCLPVIFAVVVFRMNPSFFNIMLQSDIGRLLLVWCVISEIIGAVLLNRLSRIEV